MKRCNLYTQAAIWLGALLLQSPISGAALADKAYTSQFLGEDSFTTVGDNYFLPLLPGYFQVLETPNGKVKVTVTVTNRTKKVAGVETRIVTENEEKNGVLFETTDN
ncbi:MAG: hypothetical protein JOY77_06990 [Alphaproteobacteria bacterium]|nr:hypothetical protein [Alphaproteobacteria bacterium]